MASAFRFRSPPCISVLIALAFGCACAPGCATLGDGSPATKQPLDSGDPDGRPSLSALPQLPPGGSCDTPRTHQALLIAREALDTAFPAAPADRSLVALQPWVDSAVAAWIERRRAQTEATRDRFLVEGTPNAGERIVSHAVIALIDEDTASALSEIPVPSELDSEPDIAQMYRDLTRVQASPFVTSALLEFRECANQAERGPSDTRGFARFCYARFIRLQRAQAGAQASAALASERRRGTVSKAE